MKSRSNVSDPRDRALRILARRDHSEYELRAKLARVGVSAEEIDRVVSYCQEHDYLDDQRFALQRGREMMRNGKGVGSRIRVDLRDRGVPSAVIEATLETLKAEFDPLELLRQLRQRHYPEFDYTRSDDRERCRVINYFLRRGFDLSSIYAILREK